MPDLNKTKTDVMKTLVKQILERPLVHSWSQQGLGMLRVYLSREVRMHVWADEAIYSPKPDKLHTHPWDFTSLVIAGQIANIRYIFLPKSFPPNYTMRTIKCGIGGGLEPGEEHVHLASKNIDIIETGQSYNQWADEIHETIPVDGTVTVIKRQFRPDTEHAKVFSPLGQLWKSAEPIIPTAGMIERACRNSLERFF